MYNSCSRYSKPSFVVYGICVSKGSSRGRPRNKIAKVDNLHQESAQPGVFDVLIHERFDVQKEGTKCVC